MVFFFKNKKIQLDCFVSDAAVQAYNFNPIAPANHFTPAWWRTVPLSFPSGKIPKESGWVIDAPDATPIPTIRGCPAVRNQLRSGFIIPMWTDLSIQVGPGENFKSHAADHPLTTTIEHPELQRGNMFNSFKHSKIISPWLFKCSRNINWVWQQPSWHLETSNERFKVMPGVIDFYYQHKTNVHLFIRRSMDTNEFVIPAGHPLVQIIPLTESEIELHLHVVTQQEYTQLESKQRRVHFLGQYFKTKKLMKQQDRGRCPLHFWK